MTLNIKHSGEITVKRPDEMARLAMQLDEARRRVSELEAEVKHLRSTLDQIDTRLDKTDVKFDRDVPDAGPA